jgi:hypothetical protein
MQHGFRIKVPTVHDTGAPAGSVLRGAVPNNQGLRLRVLEDQPPGLEGPVAGRFVLLDAGDNKHADALRPLLHRETDAREVLEALRRRRPGCVSVANTNILTAAAGDGEGP